MSPVRKYAGTSDFSNGVKPFLIKPTSSVKGKILLLGDKSIACRSVIISAISNGKTTIRNFPSSKDSLAAVSVYKKLGIRIAQDKIKNTITIFGKGLYGLREPKGPVSTDESGTVFRLTLGLLAGQNFQVKLTAGKSLSKRPMHRVTMPLRKMGVKIDLRLAACGLRLEECPPITIRGGSLKHITYRMPVASAQVKSALILAGLYAKGRTTVIEPVITRDHTERMLKLFKANIKSKGNSIIVEGRKELVSPGRIYIPGDISSASFFMVLAAILPNSKLSIKNVSLNPSRIGIIRVLKRMNADIRVAGNRMRDAGFEPMGDISIKSSSLRGAVVKEKEIPSLIDELPILMVAACYAKGKTVFKGVRELRVKETDRIKSMSENLRKMGADIKVISTAKSEDILIQGVKELKGAKVKSFADHRTAMSMVVAGLKAKGTTVVDDISCIDKSFPEFPDLLKLLLIK